MTRYRQAPGALTRRVGREIVVSVPTRSDFDLLTGPAGDVWRFLESPRSLGELVTLLSESYAASPERIRGDVEQLLAQMVARGSIEEVWERGG